MNDKLKKIPVDDSWMRHAEYYLKKPKFHKTNTDIWIKVLSKLRTKRLIKLEEESLKRNEMLLDNNPNSLFYKGMVKNCKERIEELKHKIK